MIAEWLYWFTCQIGRNFNRALGFEDNSQSNLLTGISLIWFLMVMLLFILCCVLILIKLDKKES